MRVFFDGVRIGEHKRRGGLRINRKVPAFIGSSSGSSEFFQGDLDELHLYGEALSAKAIGEKKPLILDDEKRRLISGDEKRRLILGDEKRRLILGVGSSDGSSKASGKHSPDYDILARKIAEDIRNLADQKRRG